MGPPVNFSEGGQMGKARNLGTAGPHARSSALQSLTAVAAPEPQIDEPPNAAIRTAVGWGVLELVRNWPDEDAETDGGATLATGATDPSSDVWLDWTTRRGVGPPHLTLLPSPEAPFDHRAAGVALRQVLAEWRIGARALDRCAEGSLERSRLRAQVIALREAYHRLFREIRGPVAG
jgi:hypothetical protein